MKILLSKLPAVLPVLLTFLTFIGGALLSDQLELLQVARLAVIINILAYVTAMLYGLWFLVKYADDHIYSGFMATTALACLIMGSMAVGDLLWYVEEYSDLKISLELNIVWSVIEFFTAVLVGLMVYSFKHCERVEEEPWNGQERRSNGTIMEIDQGFFTTREVTQDERD